MTTHSLKEMFWNHRGLLSDKWEQYVPVYESELGLYLERGKPISLLEIGVQNGGSLEVWKKFLPPQSRLVGIDIDERCRQLDLSDGIELYVCDATHNDAVNNVLGDTRFDIIIDDGSHRSVDVIASFKILFERLKDGGVYIVEDTHASYWADFGGGFRAKGSSIEWAKDLVDSLHADHFESTPQIAKEDLAQLQALSTQIARISFFDSMVVVQKYSGPKRRPFARLLTGADTPLVDPVEFLPSLPVSKLRELLVAPPLAQHLDQGILRLLEAREREAKRQTQELNRQLRELERQSMELRKLEQSLSKSEMEKSQADVRAAAMLQSLEDLRSQLEAHHRKVLSVETLQRLSTEAACKRETALLKQLDASRNELKKRKAALRKKLKSSRSKLNSVRSEYESSTSWRVSAPIRVAKRAQRVIGRLLRGTRKTLSVHEDVPSPEPEAVKVLSSDDPTVTVIVPNYNHTNYLTKRLETVYGQTYEKFHVILLDDCSSDDSIHVLSSFLERYPEKTTLITNSVNSGSGYRQWAKGIRAAAGELIWIAESDDWCEPSFLEALVPKFVDESVALAYTNSTFMNAAGTDEIWSTDEYLKDVDPELWHHSFEATAHEIVAKGLATKNIVPNVSAALFRHPGTDSPLLNAPWTKMKICGDWLFYLKMILGGRIAYCPQRLNYYRVHDSSTAQKSFSTDAYYKEHESVANFVLENFEVDPSYLTAQTANLLDQWQRCRGDFTEQRFSDCYSASRIVSNARSRRPNILMVTFAFTTGGGETFPIALANVLRIRGYSVTVLSCEQEPMNQGIRELLRPDIPVVYDWLNLNRIVEEFGIDIIHTHHAWVEHAVLDQLPVNSRAQLVTTLHGMYETMNDVDFRNSQAVRLITRAASVVYVARKNLITFEALEIADHPKLQMIRNALPVSSIEPPDLELIGIPPTAFTVCVASRGIPEKGWVEAIETIRLARKLTQSDIHLLLLGDGPESRRLMELGSLPDYTHLLGFKNNVRDYFAAADLGFLPSRFKGESAPCSLIECLSTGTPFLATDLGEISEMLSSPTGVAGAVFPLLDENVPVENFARFIADCATNPTFYRELCSAVPEASKKFDPDRMVDQYVTVYQNAIAQNGTATEKSTFNGSVARGSRTVARSRNDGKDLVDERGSDQP